MKYSEFKAEVEKLGFGIKDKNDSTQIMHNQKSLSIISKIKVAEIDTYELSPSDLSDSVKCELLRLGYELAKTPLADREEEKRYYLKKILIPLLRENDDKWYSKPLLPNYRPRARRDREQNFQYQTIFTESEIKKMDITGFYKEEVK